MLGNQSHKLLDISDNSRVFPDLASTPHLPLRTMDHRPNNASTPWADGPAFHECLQDLPAQVVEALNKVATKRHWRRGDVVQAQGQVQHSVMVCQKGRLAAMVASPSGSDTLLRFLLVGEMVGLPSVLAGTLAPSSVVANSEAETLSIERQAFIQVLTEFPEGAIGIAVLLSNRLSELFRFVEMTAHRTLSERVNYALRRLCRRNGEPDKNGMTRLKITQGEIATAAGASRQRVHLELRRLQAQGLISLGYGEIIIKTDKL